MEITSFTDKFFRILNQLGKNYDWEMIYVGEEKNDLGGPMERSTEYFFTITRPEELGCYGEIWFTYFEECHRCEVLLVTRSYLKEDVALLSKVVNQNLKMDLDGGCSYQCKASCDNHEELTAVSNTIEDWLRLLKQKYFSPPSELAKS